MAVTLHAGLLKRAVVFNEPTSTRTNTGGKELTYEEAFTAKAHIQGTNKRDQQVNPELLDSQEVYIRYASERSGITKDWTLTYDGKDHVIHGIDLIGVERNQYIKLFVKAK